MATEGIGYNWFSFIELNKNSQNIGIGLYRIHHLKIISDETFAYVEFISLLTQNEILSLENRDFILFDMIYSSDKVCIVDNVFELDNPFNKRNVEEYDSGIITYTHHDGTIEECNCDEFNKYLEGVEQVEGDNNPDRVINLLSHNVISMSALLDILTKPSKMLRYARRIKNPNNFESLKDTFPVLYNKLNAQFNPYDYGIENQLYDYFCRAHKKFLRYYENIIEAGFYPSSISMEQELKEVFKYEKMKKDKEKEERRKKRKNKNGE